MTEVEAIELIERLKNACTFNRFEDPGVYAEYLRALKGYDYGRMDAAIDAAIEEDSRNVPAISLLVKKYKDALNAPKDRFEVKNGEYCTVCDDRGYVLMKEVQKSGDMDIPYQYVLYCPFCPVGRSQAYDGRNISDKEHRSPYIVPPLTEYFGDEGIQLLRDANLKKRNKKTGVVRPTEKEFQANLQTIGKSISNDWKYDVEIPF
ncbi:MAG TPA: hypothetical protein GXX36_10475 [Clostridiaceae bacterium]|nr:hypothetical protein [Clostridiaceae bacterium]